MEAEAVAASAEGRFGEEAQGEGEQAPAAEIRYVEGEVEVAG